MSDNTFSTPVVEVEREPHQREALADTVYGEQHMEVDENLSPALYEARFGKPYAMDALGVSPQHLKASPGMMENLREVDGFILEQMNKNGLEMTKEGYEEMLDNIYEMLGISKNTTAAIKISKLAQLIKIRGLKPIKLT